MKKLFQLGASVPQKTLLAIEILGLIFFLLVWFVITFPVENTAIQFSSNNAKLPSTYKWKLPDNSLQNFNGDNVLINAKTGNYEFTFIDSCGCEIKATLNVPNKISDKISKTFETQCKKSKQNITLSVDILTNKDGWLVSKGTLPTPQSVIISYGDLMKDFVIWETGYSLILNILGYLEAILFSIILGFLIGLIPFFRGLLSRYVNAIRFIPLTAVTGIFIAWFSIYTNMKVQFLAFGIFVYLLPVVVQRIDEIEKVYLQTAYTLGATKWQTIKDIYFPYVTSKIIDDIRVLTAISWTYVIIAEMLNQTGGIGALIYLAGRQSRIDKVFALLLIIIVIGILQDKFFSWLDKILFPHKTRKTAK